MDVAAQSAAEPTGILVRPYVSFVVRIDHRISLQRGSADTKHVDLATVSP